VGTVAVMYDMDDLDGDPIADTPDIELRPALREMFEQLRAAHADTVVLRSQVRDLEQIIASMEATIPLIVAGVRRPLLAQLVELTCQSAATTASTAAGTDTDTGRETHSGVRAMPPASSGPQPEGLSPEVSLKLLFSRAERNEPTADEPRELTLAREVIRLYTDQARLHALVQEMLPVFAADVRDGVALGPPPDDHLDDNCADCIWYRESLARQARLDAGEFALVNGHG
jgi:hypothetical protein